MTASNDTEVKPDRVTQLEREGDIAADYLEALLDIADLDGDIDTWKATARWWPLLVPS